MTVKYFFIRTIKGKTPQIKNCYNLQSIAQDTYTQPLINIHISGTIIL